MKLIVIDIVFAKRIKYRSIFNNDDYSFNELQVRRQEII